MVKLENKYNSKNEAIFNIYILGIILILSVISIKLVLQLLKPSFMESIIYIIAIIFVYTVILIVFRQINLEQKNVIIPIDIYVYKNKAYADLDSVDLTKVEGFNDAIKYIEFD